MEMRNLLFLYLLLLFIPQFSSLRNLSLAFTPDDNYLINCGGSNVSTTTDDTRTFVGDLTEQGSIFLSDSRTEPLTDQNPSRNSSPLYHTARVFTKEFNYEFGIKRQGLHMVRLHFFPFPEQNYDLRSAKFHVSVDGASLLRDFSTSNSVVLKEYVVMVNSGKLVIMFTPVTKKGSGFGFINGIEVFSTPDDFVVLEGARFVGAKGIEEYTDPSSSHVLETVHRVNVGGQKITPFNDTLWRTWIPDENFLVFKPAARAVSRSSPPNYQAGGASRDIAPDHVYMTAQEMNRNNLTMSPDFNITWDLPLSSSGGIIRYLVRMHFCDIVSSTLNLLYFDVYINDFSAYKDLDLSQLTVHRLASPCYIDFVVDSEKSNTLRVSVGPSGLSSPSRINAILNGLEIMKMVSSDELLRKSESNKKKTIGVVAGSVLGGFGLLIVAILLMMKCRKKKLKRKSIEATSWSPLAVQGGSSNSKVSQGTIAGLSSGPNIINLGLKISFAEIQYATNNFDKQLVIGSGGFGMVYKGVLRDNTKVAVKRGVSGSSQGLPEFQSEITVLSKIRHRHLVSLVGYCEEQLEMILVYELMEKGPLRSHLYGSSGLPPLSWKQRLEICIGSARGLHYLHTGSAQGIIHRDVKSTNILLDENYCAKVADFGLSRLGPCLDQTHVSTAVKGSFGYFDPEYFKLRQLTDKSDVYSFGVVLLEVLCARPAINPSLSREQMNLAEWAMEWQKKGLLEHIVDPRLAGDIKPNSLRKFGDTVEKCLADYGVDRPTMGDVLWNLEYCLQLQQTARPREAHEEDSGIHDAPELPVPVAVSRVPFCSTRIDGDDSTESSSTTQVFSQLITNEGR